MNGLIDMDTLGYFLYMQEQEKIDEYNHDKEAEEDDLWISQDEYERATSRSRTKGN